MRGWFSAVIERRTLKAWAPIAILLGAVLAVATALAVSAGTAAGNTATCNNTAATLAGSGFEIDVDANQVVNTAGCIDWLDTSTAAGLQPFNAVKVDDPSGSGDGSFGNGTKEDTAQPSVVDGGIPPNKSDLKAFGLFTEKSQSSTDGSVDLFWSRVQDPSGTTNMDFELNQNFCDLSATPTNCADNGITPLRTVDDKLITYDLSRGGTRATISIRNWGGSSWGPATVLTDQNPVQALGTINTSAITAANSLTQVGALSPRTFGEASVSFDALFGDDLCGQFGSAYLKSRSSDSFTAALKDFVPPQKVEISNCPTGLTTNSTPTATVGEKISDTATLSGANDPNGTVDFTLYGPFTGNDPTQDECIVDNAVFTSNDRPLTGPNAQGDYTASSAEYTTTEAGRYQWVASYSGDTNGNQDSTTACNDPNEQSVVSKVDSSISTVQTLIPNDTATIPDGATGTVTFKLFGPDNATCSSTGAAPVINQTKTIAAPTPEPNSVSTNNSTIITTAGTYNWLVTYSGDNTYNPDESACGDEHVTIQNDLPSSSS